MELSEKFNKKRAVVYNTYQFYLNETPTILKQHLEYSTKVDFFLGGPGCSRSLPIQRENLREKRRTEIKCIVDSYESQDRYGC